MRDHGIVFVIYDIHYLQCEATQFLTRRQIKRSTLTQPQISCCMTETDGLICRIFSLVD